jgi:hypothetical protein
MLDSILHGRAQDWVSGWLNEAQVPAGTPLGNVDADTAYLNIFLRSARIVNVRTGLRRFYGAVHSCVSVKHRSQGTSKFNVFTTPNELKNIDSSHMDRVVQGRVRLLGPVPYAGGDLEMQAGLFSVAAADLAAPYLALLETLSNAAGVSFISTALPFAKPIMEGVKLLTESDKDSLEIGISETQATPQQGYRVVMRAPKDAVSLADLRMDHSDCRLLDRNGKPIADYPYIVFESRGEEQRSDWFAIPELGKAYGSLQEAVLANNRKDADAALDRFRRVALTCNDLTPGDADRVARKGESIYRAVGPPAKATRGAVRDPQDAPSKGLPDLSDLQIYQSYTGAHK